MLVVEVDIKNIMKSQRQKTHLIEETHIPDDTRGDRMALLVNSLRKKSDKVSVDSKKSSLAKYDITLSKLKCILHRQR